MGAEAQVPTRLVSQLVEADPEMIDIVQEFVAGLPERVESLVAAFRAGDLERLVVLAHQLKGAGGSYGYPDISEAARTIEYAARSGTAEGLERHFSRLEALCAAAAAAIDG